MATVIVMAFVLLVGPLSLIYGKDSRITDTRDRRRWL
jgi:hypothetical protein